MINKPPKPKIKNKVKLTPYIDTLLYYIRDWLEGLFSLSFIIFLLLCAIVGLLHIISWITRYIYVDWTF